MRIFGYDPKTKKKIAFCSGFLSGSDQIVTAGHCLDDMKEFDGAKGIFVEVYDDSIKKRVPISISNKLGVNGFDTGGQEEDLALVKLTRRVGKPGKSVGLPMAASGCDDDKAIAAGFGMTTTNSEAQGISQIPRFACFRKENDLEKGKSKPTSSHYDSYRAQGKQVCSGDSGGPVFCKSKGKLAIAGVISQSHAHARTGKTPASKGHENCGDFNNFEAHKLDSQARSRLDSWQRKMDAQAQSAASGSAQ